MASRRHLNRAPITEALVDLRASAVDSLDNEAAVSALRGRVGDSYVRYQKRIGLHFAIQGTGAKTERIQQAAGFHGHFFESEDRRNVAQFRENGCTYNRLAPYTDGKAVLEEAIRLWNLYVEVAKPKGVQRVALRYINHLKLDVAPNDLEGYLVDPSVTPPGAPGAMEEFLVRRATDDARSGIQVILNIALERLLTPGPRTIVLDIDAFKFADLPVDADSIRRVLNDLRDVKNDVFFGSITETTAELYA